jgi:hypothetical protein
LDSSVGIQRHKPALESIGSNGYIRSGKQEQRSFPAFPFVTRKNMLSHHPFAQQVFLLHSEGSISF